MDSRKIALFKNRLIGSTKASQNGNLIDPRSNSLESLFKHTDKKGSS